MSIRTFHEQNKADNNDPLMQALAALKKVEDPREVTKATSTSAVANWVIWTDQD